MCLDTHKNKGWLFTQGVKAKEGTSMWPLFHLVGTQKITVISLSIETVPHFLSYLTAVLYYCE